MKQDLTEIVFVMDRSGSMAPLTDDTIGGFNGLIQKQKLEPGEALVTTVLFHHDHQMIHDRIPLEQVPPMTRKDYVAAGMTAMLDALGWAMDHVENIHKYARPEDVPARTLFVITTDGMENASKHYHLRQVRSRIGQLQEKGWEFLFLGANMDAVSTARNLNIGRDRAVEYCADACGTAANFEAIGRAFSHVRQGGAIREDWKAPVERDRKRRETGILDAE